VNLLVVGTNHRIATVAVRERLATCVGLTPVWLAAERDQHSAITELFVLATCHRVELYAATDDPEGARAALVALTRLGEGGIFDSDTPRYVLTGEDAVRHLCRVACGLDSVIVGEAEISGQVRRAAALAREAGTLGPYLERLIAAALRSSGRARAETEIGRGVLSAASAGVTLAASTLGTLEGRSVLVVGAGQTGRQVLARVRRLGCGELFIASRSEKHATEAAAQAGATVVPFGAMTSMLDRVDVLFTAVQVPAQVVHSRDLSARLRPMFIVDLSVPRAVDPSAGELPLVDLRTVDDLGDIAQASLARRAREVPRVEAIAHDEAARALHQIRSRAARARQHC
jgi:glutamyl-tRNA reductase